MFTEPEHFQESIMWERMILSLGPDAEVWRVTIVVAIAKTSETRTTLTGRAGTFEEHTVKESKGCGKALSGTKKTIVGVVATSARDVRHDLSPPPALQRWECAPYHVCRPRLRKS